MAPDIYFPNLGLEIQKLNRVALNVFDIDIYWYGILITLGIMAGIYLAMREVKRTKQDENLYYDFAFIVVIAAVIGARLYYVIFEWENYKNNLLKIFAFREGGLAIYGAIIASALTAIIYTKLKKIKFSVFADTAVPGLLIGQIIGRWGNFFNKEAFGGYTNNILAMSINTKVASYIPDSLIGKEILYKGAEYIQVHPTFLYESIWNLALLVLLIIYRKYKKYDGELLILYLGGYGLGRFWIEGLRTDQLLLWNTNIPVSQALSFFLLIFALIYEVYKLFFTKRLTIQK